MSIALEEGTETQSPEQPKGLRLSDAQRLAAERLESESNGSLQEALAGVVIDDPDFIGPRLGHRLEAIDDACTGQEKMAGEKVASVDPDDTEKADRRPEVASNGSCVASPESVGSPDLGLVASDSTAARKRIDQDTAVGRSTIETGEQVFASADSLASHGELENSIISTSATVELVAAAKSEPGEVEELQASSDYARSPIDSAPRDEGDIADLQTLSRSDEAFSPPEGEAQEANKNEGLDCGQSLEGAEAPSPFAAPPTDGRQIQTAEAPDLDGKAQDPAEISAEAQMAALQNLKRLLERQLPEPGRLPPNVGLTPETREPIKPPPLPHYGQAPPPNEIQEARLEPAFVPADPPPPPRGGLDVRGFLAGFALSGAIGAMLYVYLVAG